MSAAVTAAAPSLADHGGASERWSRENRAFLAFVERNPECLRRSAFASIDEEAAELRQPIQPWPLFVGARERGEMEAVALGVDALAKGAIARFLRSDPAAVLDFYRTRGTVDGAASLALELNEEMLAVLLEEPSGIAGAPSRADYIETEEGLRCIEYNAGGFLGGLHTETIAGLYLRAEPVARFLAERGVRARPPAVARALFRHVVEDTARLGVWGGGDFNLAMVVRPHDPGWVARHSAEAYTRDLHGAMAQAGYPAAGRVLLCSLDEIGGDGFALELEGHPVHAVVEQHNGEGDIRPVFRAFKLGTANLFSGPIGDILSDKRNLVLLSEHAASSDFTAAERALIERHIPWTRRVVPSRTTFRGRAFHIPGDLAGHREQLVLKKASSVGGDWVVVGRFHTDDAWRRTVARAVAEEDWVVQEYLPTVPYLFQGGEAGAEPQELVWGLFAFGGHFGGAFLRMHPAGGGDGVVNTRRGAQAGAVLEIAE